MEPDLIDSNAYKINKILSQFKKRFSSLNSSVFAVLFSILSIFLKCDPVLAAQNDRIITVITSLTQDIYQDFVYLSLGFCTTVCIFHLICIVFQAGDERGRNKHIKAIITAVIAWALINIFAFLIAKIFALTGANSPSDIFNAGGYGS